MRAGAAVWVGAAAAKPRAVPTSHSRAVAARSEAARAACVARRHTPPLPPHACLSARIQLQCHGIEQYYNVH